MRPKLFSSSSGTLPQSPPAIVENRVADDRKLVRRCLAGDADAIRTLVRTFQGIVFGLCFRMTRQREDAEDITQDVLIRSIRSLKSWDRCRPLRPWILAIAANRCRTYLQQKSRRPQPTDSLADVPDLRRPVHDRELAGELEIALAELRPEYRMVVIMFHHQELPYEEISAVMNRPIGTVKTWLHRARAEMARHLASRACMADLVRSEP
jgi:RNA polymerase sigma-70 factor (ECF subfamily)